MTKGERINNELFSIVPQRFSGSHRFRRLHFPSAVAATAG